MQAGKQADMQAGKIYKDSSTCTVSTYKTGPTHSDTHSDVLLENPRSQRRRDELGGSSSAGYLHAGGRGCSAVRHLSMVVQLCPQVTRSGLVPVEEPTWSSRSPRAEITVTDGTHEGSTNASKRTSQLHERTTNHQQHDTTHPTNMLLFSLISSDTLLS